MTVNHLKLIELAKKLSYSVDDTGICGGYSGMLLQALLQDNEALDTFQKRLEFISKHDSSDLVQSIREAQEKAKHPKTDLSKLDLSLLEILSFIEGIILYQAPNNHSKIFGKHRNQSDIEAISKYTASQTMEENKTQSFVVKMAEGFHAFDRAELISYISKLSSLLSKQDKSVATKLSSDNHHIVCHFDREHRTWSFYDINQLGIKGFVIRTQSHQELAQRIFTAFQDKGSTVFSHSFWSLGQKTEEILTNTLKDFEKEMMKNNHLLVTVNRRGAGLLFLAANEGNYDLAIHLIKNVSLNQESSYGVTPLYMAAQNGHLNIVNALLNKGAWPNIKTTFDYTPLFVAVLNGHEEIVRALLKNGSEINQKNWGNMTALHLAAYMGSVTLTDTLLKHGADPHAISQGYTPLKISIERGHQEVSSRIRKYISSKEKYSHNTDMLTNNGRINEKNLNKDKTPNLDNKSIAGNGFL